MNIVHRSFMDKENISIVEDEYNAKYVCDTSLKLNNKSYANIPVAVFYTETPHPEGSNYFGVFVNHLNRFFICNAVEVVDQDIKGVVASNSNVYYSAYRHDYYESGDVMIDGGRDYYRYSGTLVDLKVIDGEMVIVNE